MVQVEFNKKNSNPFYGMKNTLEIYQDASKGLRLAKSKLEAAWSEASESPEKMAVLFSVLFFVGDVTNRQHNIFDGKVEGGGNSQREVFRTDVVPFLAAKTKKMLKPKRLELMRLITEYTTMDNIFATRVQTAKKSTKVVSVIDMVSIFGIEDVAAYAADIILEGTTFQKICVAKFVTRPRFSKRAGKERMLPETVKIMETRAKLLTSISKRAKLLVEDKGSYINFTGFYNWRKEFNQDFESVLFSSGRVNGMDKEEFIQFIDKIPSDARFRVRNRVMFNEKWSKLKGWYEAWEKFKDDKQAEQRKLEAKISQGTATASDKAKLKSVRKEAKVNTGSVSFTKMYEDIVKGTVDKVKVQPFLDKVKLPYNSLVFMDDSGSMGWGGHGTPYKPYQFASFMATICMMKNPDEDARNLIGLFAGNARMYNGISSQTVRANSLMRGRTVGTPNQPLIREEDHFLDNLDRMTKWLAGKCTNGMTNVSSIPDGLHKWVNGDPNRLEELQKYPVWTLISDGEFNNLRSAEASLNDFMRRCEKYFGFKPYLILIDVARNKSAKITQFSGIDNVMLVPPNPANIEMLLTNFNDMDTYDVYTPLLSLSRANRYAPIREYVEANF